MYKRLSRIIIAVILAITALNIFFIFKLQFNYDFESFFSASDGETTYYFNFRDNFENDSDYNLIGIENEEGIFQPDFLLRVDSLCKDLKKVKYAEKVQSITTSKTFLASSYSITPIKLLHLDDFSRLSGDSSNIYSLKELVGTLVSEDAKALAILVKKVNMPPSDTVDRIEIKARETKFVEQVEATIAKYEFDDVHLAGRIKAENYYVEKMKWEIVFFVGSSVVLIIFFLYMAFKSLWGVVLPMFIVFLSVIWCMGFISIAGQKIDIMTVLLPTIMFVVGMSDVVHIVTKYLQELRNGAEKLDALKVTIKEVGLATLLTSVTTAVGFLTLLTSGVTPIQNFGLYTAIGVMLAFILSFTFLPAVLLNMKKPHIATKSEKKLFWNSRLESLFIWTLNHRKTVMLTALIASGLSIYGISKIEINAQLVDEVNDGDPLKDDFVFFEENFAGVRPFEVALQNGSKSKGLLEYRTLQEIDKVETFLAKEGGVKQITSPLTLFKIMNRATHNGDPDEFKFPDEKSYQLVSKYAQKFRKKKELGMILTEDMQLGRLSGIQNDIGSLEFQRIRTVFDEFIKTEVDTNYLKPKLTGSALLIDNTNDQLSKNMMIGLALAFGVIALVMGLLFRSLRIVLISFIPNVIPLLLIGGILGFTGIGLKISTSIIFTIAFGIAVDDTIHFMSKFKIELMKGRSYLYAIKRTFISTGKAIIITSIILIAGFLTLMYSDFNGTFYTGLLVSLTLIFAVVADIFLIPVLLIEFISNERVDKMRSLFSNSKE